MWSKAGPALLPVVPREGDAWTVYSSGAQENHPGSFSNATFRGPQADQLKQNLWGWSLTTTRASIFHRLNVQWRLRIFALGAPRDRQEEVATGTHQTQRFHFSCKAELIDLRLDKEAVCFSPLQIVSVLLIELLFALKCLWIPSYDSHLKQMCNCLIRAQTIFSDLPGQQWPKYYSGSLTSSSRGRMYLVWLFSC